METKKNKVFLYRAVYHIQLTQCWMKQLFAGLDYIHRLKIVHCDIKPDNLLITNPEIGAAGSGSDDGYDAMHLAAAQNL